MHFTDRMVMDGGFRRTDDGWVVRGRVARGGNVQDYLAAELGDEGKATGKDVIRVYRPESEVFDRKAFATYARKPITMGHPESNVSPETWKDLAVGEIDRDIVRDGEFVSVPLLFRDAKAVEALQADGAPRELSMGYDANVTFADGITPSGEPYDAIMGDFKMNHVAVVKHARAGHGARFGDASVDGGKDRATWGATPLIIDRKDDKMADAIKTRTVIVDGLSVETTDQGAQALEKLTSTIAAKDKAIADAAADHAKAIAAKDADLAKAHAERDDFKSKVLDAAALDKLVQARGDLIVTAKAIAKDVKTEGLSDADIRKAVVAAALPDLSLADKSPEYIAVRFDVLAESITKDGTDPVADVLKAGVKTNATDAKSLADKALHDSVTDLNAWRYQKEA